MDIASLLEVFWNSVNRRQPVLLDFRAMNTPCLSLPAQTQPFCPCSSTENSARLRTESNVVALILSSARACSPGPQAISNGMFTTLSSTEVSIRYHRGDLLGCPCLPSHGLWCRSHAENGGREEVKSLIGGQRLSAVPSMEINKK